MVFKGYVNEVKTILKKKGWDLFIRAVNENKIVFTSTSHKSDYLKNDFVKNLKLL